MIINKKENWYEELFDVFVDHGLTLTQTEISDIIHEVHKVSEAEKETLINLGSKSKKEKYG